MAESVIIRFRCKQCRLKVILERPQLPPGTQVSKSAFWCPHCKTPSVISYIYTEDGVGKIKFIHPSEVWKSIPKPKGKDLEVEAE